MFRCSIVLYCEYVFSVFLKLHSYFSDECVHSETFVFCNLSKIQKINPYPANVEKMVNS